MFSPPVTDSTALAYALAALIVVFLSKSLSRPKKNLPPGPRGLPFVGNLFQLSEDPCQIFTDWKKVYGPIIYLNLAGQDVIVLGSLKVASDLLDQRAAIYSDRPEWVVACGMLTEGLFFPFTRYGDLWRRMRRAAHEGLHKNAIRKYEPIQSKEALLLLDDLHKDPNAWEMHVRRTGGSTVLSVGYDSPTLKSVEDTSMAGIYNFTLHLVQSAYIDGHLVELFPWLKYLPSSLMSWKRRATQGSLRYSALFHGLFNETKAHKVNGESLVANMIQNQKKYDLADKEIAWLVAAIAAGSETMAGVLSWFLLAMVLNPEVQKKAQAELDAVVGRNRVPSFADWDHLPYIRAIVKEAIRWHPVDPLGLQHRSTEDDFYEGYFIPKGTVCIANVWAMNRDPEVFGLNATEFDPDRHLDETGKLKPAPLYTKDESHVSFGFGRRVCVGRHLANKSLFLNIASLLWMYNISAPVNHDGTPVPLSEDSVNEGLVVRPVSHKHKFTPRFADAVTMVAQSLEDLDL